MSDNRTIHITFDEGEPANVRVKPYHLMLSEEKFGLDKAYGLSGTMYAAYMALHPGIPFKAWAQTVDTFGEKPEDEPEVEVEGNE